MSYLEFNLLSGPHGDETCWYKIKTDAKTVGEFIDILLEGQSQDNFMTVCIRGKKDDHYDIRRDVAVAYIESNRISGEERNDSCHIVRKANKYDDYLNVKIERIEANGGWGNNTFNIFTEDNIEEQDREDFSMVYWGYLI